METDKKKHSPWRLIAILYGAVFAAFGLMVYSGAVGISGSLDLWGITGSRVVRMSAPSKVLVGADLVDRTSVPIEAEHGSISRIEVGLLLDKNDAGLYWQNVYSGTEVSVTKDERTYQCPSTDQGFVCPVGLRQGESATVNVESTVTAAWRPGAFGYLVRVNDANLDLTKPEVVGAGNDRGGPLHLAQVSVADGLEVGYCLITRSFSEVYPSGGSYESTKTDVELCQ